MDDNLFANIRHNPHHVLYKLLPDKTEHTYNLRPRSHSFSSTVKTDSRNYINRMLFKDIYLLAPVYCMVAFCQSFIKVMMIMMMMSDILSVQSTIPCFPFSFSFYPYSSPPLSAPRNGPKIQLDFLGSVLSSPSWENLLHAFDSPCTVKKPYLTLDLSPSRIQMDGCIGPHVDAILLCLSPVLRLHPRWCPCPSNLVWWCPSNFFLGRPGFLL